MLPFAATIKKVRSCGNIFYRVVIAHANRAAYNMFEEDYVQSFAPKYIAAESGDYKKIDDDKFLDLLVSLGKFKKIDFDDIELYI